MHHLRVKILEIQCVLGVRVKKDGVQLHALGNQLGQNILPSTKTKTDSWFLIPPFFQHTLVYVGMCLNNQMFGGLVSLQGRINDAHTESDIHDTLSLDTTIDGTAFHQNLGVCLHERPFPFHHNGVLVGVQQGLAVGRVRQALAQIIGFGAGLLFHGSTRRYRNCGTTIPRRSFQHAQNELGPDAPIDQEIDNGPLLGVRRVVAGTPSVADPGTHWIRRVRETLPEVAIVPIPGPSALTTALSVCGWQTNPALYAGFLSPKAGRRRSFLERYRDFDGLIVLFESVHRVEKLIEDIREIFPRRDIFIAREMSKLYEEFRVLPAGSTGSGDFPTRKGEFTLIIGPEREDLS